MRDFYSPVAEFYDIVTRTYPDGENALRAVLSDVDPSAGPVLDVGAGTGRTADITTEVLPDAQVIAVEPAPVMRAVLTHRVAQNDRLRKRVTIVPDPIESAPLPDSLAAVVLFGVIGHLDEPDRARLWARLLPLLAPGAPVIVELLPITRPQLLPPMPFARERIGGHLYEATLEGEPAGGDLMRLTSTWRVSGERGDLRVIRNTSEWHTFGLDDLAVETGLVAEQLTTQVGVLRQPAPEPATAAEPGREQAATRPSRPAR